MKKMKLAVLLCILVFVITACGKNQNKNSENPTDTPTDTPTAAPTEEPTTEPTEPPVNSLNAQEVISEILTAVKEAYGDKYVPSMQFDEVSMEEFFGINSDLYDAYAAEGPMITAHIDTFVAVHATQGNAQAVEDALNAYRDRQINDAFQYPSNMLKIQASKVYAVEDYVFFITLGNIENTESAEFTDESQYIEAYEELNQIAIDEINKVLSN